MKRLQAFPTQKKKTLIYVGKCGPFQPFVRLRHLSFRSTAVRQGLNLYWARARAHFPFPNAITAALRCFTSSSVQGMRGLGPPFLVFAARAGAGSSAVLSGCGHNRAIDARSLFQHQIDAAATETSLRNNLLCGELQLVDTAQNHNRCPKKVNDESAHRFAIAKSMPCALRLVDALRVVEVHLLRLNPGMVTVENQEYSGRNGCVKLKPPTSGLGARSRWERSSGSTIQLFAFQGGTCAFMD